MWQLPVCAVPVHPLLPVLCGIQLKWLCMQKSWIPHGVTCLLWASSAVGIAVCLSIWLPPEGTAFVCLPQWIHLESFSDQWPVLLLSQLCTSARLSFFSLPINTDAEQEDVVMKWMWHLCRWLRAETESQSLQCFVSILAVVTVCMSQHMDEQQAAMGMVLGSLLTSEGIGQHALYVIQPLVVIQLWRDQCYSSFYILFSPAFELFKE